LLVMLVLQWEMGNGPEKHQHLFGTSNTWILMAKLTRNLLQVARAFVLIYLTINATAWARLSMICSLMEDLEVVQSNVIWFIMRYEWANKDYCLIFIGTNAKTTKISCIHQIRGTKN
jgi:hypothetical protein